MRPLLPLVPLLAGLLLVGPQDARACGGKAGSAQSKLRDDDAPVVAPAKPVASALVDIDDDGPVTAGPMSDAAREALRLFEAQRWVEAALALDRIARGDTGDDAGNRQIARYHLAIALYRLRLTQPSFDLFAAIADDRSHPRHSEALPWLAELLPEVADVNDILDHLDTYRPEDAARLLDRDLASKLAYLFGRHAFRGRNYEQAALRLAEVPPKSKHHVEALLFGGTAQVLLRKTVPAAKTFLRIPTALDEGSPDLEGGPSARALAHLAIARTYYSASVHLDEACAPTTDVAKLSAAVKFWNKVEGDGDTGAWLDSLLEQSWAYFMVGDYSHALGNLHTLQAPYFPHDLYPEADILRAIISFTNCRYEEAQTLLGRMEKTYRPVRRSLEAALGALRAEGGEDRLWIALFRGREGKAAPPLDLRPAVEIGLADRPILRRIAHARRLEAQAGLFASMPAGFRVAPVGSRAIEAITLAERLNVRAAATLAETRLVARLRDLDKHLLDANKLWSDILSAERALLMAPIGGALSIAREPPPTADIFRDNEHVVWPFDGEYWKDELGSYRQLVISRCRR